MSNENMNNSFHQQHNIKQLLFAEQIVHGYLLNIGNFVL